jgi:hypothetical protein
LGYKAEGGTKDWKSLRCMGCCSADRNSCTYTHARMCARSVKADTHLKISAYN